MTGPRNKPGIEPIPVLCGQPDDVRRGILAAEADRANAPTKVGLNAVDNPVDDELGEDTGAFLDDALNRDEKQSSPVLSKKPWSDQQAFIATLSVLGICAVPIVWFAFANPSGLSIMLALGLVAIAIIAALIMLFPVQTQASTDQQEEENDDVEP